MKIKCFGLCIALILFSAAAHAETKPAALPNDVTAFLENRDMCNRYVNEMPTDEAQEKELEKKITQSCDGLDDQQKALDKKYKGNKAVIDAIGTEEQDEVPD